MNTFLSRRFALLAAAALFAHAALAANGPKPPPPPPQPPPQPSSGTLVLDYLGPEGSGAYNWGLAVAHSGTIYALGSDVRFDGYWKQLVLASSDSGSTWSLLDEFAPPGRFVDFSYGLGGGITSDPSGNLYLTGGSVDNDFAQPAESYVRRSTDGGANWTTVDNVVLPFTFGADEVGIAADEAGDVYVPGPLWTIGKGVGGNSFSTVDALPNSYPKDIFVHPTWGIFVAGQTQITIKGKTSWAWLVRRSTDGGATWSNVDTFQLSSSQPAVAVGIGVDSSGNLYVVGSGSALYNRTLHAHWIVRKSTNGGNSWTTVDDYQLAADNSSSAGCFAADSNGNLFVAGTGAGKWLVRKSVGGTGPWTTLDVFQYGGSYRTDANAIAADALGNVFVVGFALESSGSDHWLIKRY